MRNQFEALASGHQSAFEKTFTANQIDILENISKEIIHCFKSGGKLLLCGNGGSAADAQHIAAEFVARFELERRSLPAIALTTDTSALTAISNDYDYSRVFSRQVEGLGNKGDILIAISTSGQSGNVLEAVNEAKRKEILTIGFTGKDGGSLKDLTDLTFVAKSDKTSHIQEMHITALHAISEVVERVLFGS